MNKKYELLIKKIDDEWNVISMTDKETKKYYKAITGLDENIPIFDMKDYLLEYATESLIEEKLISYEEAGKLIDYIEKGWKK